MLTVLLEYILVVYHFHVKWGLAPSLHNLIIQEIIFWLITLPYPLEIVHRHPLARTMNWCAKCLLAIFAALFIDLGEQLDILASVAWEDRYFVPRNSGP